MCIGMRYGRVSQWLRVLTPIKTKVSCCHVLVVQRNISSTTADGKLAEYPAVAAGQLRYGAAGNALQLDEKAGHGPPECKWMWDA